MAERSKASHSSFLKFESNRLIFNGCYVIIVRWRVFEPHFQYLFLLFFFVKVVLCCFQCFTFVTSDHKEKSLD